MHINTIHSVVRKHFLTLILICIVTIGATMFFQANTTNKNGAKAIIFTTTGIESSQLGYDEVQGSAMFAETIQGWTKNPLFLEQIISESEIEGISLTAYRQERQNMVVELTGPDQIAVKTAADYVILQLEKEVAVYNEATNSQFVIINKGVTLQEIATHSLLFSLIAGLLGALIIIIVFISLVAPKKVD